MMSESPDVIELALDSMTYGGRAVGRDQGRAIFVAYALPGERVRARLTDDHGRYAFADAVEILDPSSDRVQPPCVQFGAGRCGGCHWQYIDYATQLTFKREIVREQLRRIGGFDACEVLQTIPSPTPLGYRSHATFHVLPDGDLAYVGTDGRSLVPAADCLIVRPELQARIAGFKAQEARRIRLQIGSDAAEWLAVPISDDTSEEAASPSAYVHYIVHGRVFRASAGSFFQVNLAQAETLVTEVLARLALQGWERVLDLYAGVGLFSAFAAEKAAHVTAVEVSPSSVRDALHNLSAFSNVLVMEASVEHAMKRLRGHVDCVILDPPRAGVDAKTIASLIEKQPRRIVYVSCDPSTFARDAKRLTQAGYTLGAVQPVDMFPQTYHIELVAAFEWSV